MLPSRRVNVTGVQEKHPLWDTGGFVSLKCPERTEKMVRDAEGELLGVWHRNAAPVGSSVTGAVWGALSTQALVPLAQRVLG